MELSGTELTATSGTSEVPAGAMRFRHGDVSNLVTSLAQGYST